MKRVYVEKNIYIRISDSGSVQPKCFEVSVKTTFKKLPLAIDLFKELNQFWDNIHIYDTKSGYLVEFKWYTDNYVKAVESRNCVNSAIEGWKNERK